ncbi:MAG TPA: cobalt-precorrin-6A reductase [Rhodobacteraceae bacterium]|nr:cobalt-precorrin-6A reductase [Paracoccaceae bacterium]|tara:strand:- start:4841 stop:5575 length:735 start_codon:yes stop_codon:yes gene_type:complete
MTVLILAGSGEARQIAQYCARWGIRAIGSLAGATRQPSKLSVYTRHGGFGGADGFRDYLTAHQITAIVDATHPFASNITRRSFEIAQEMGLPLLRFERPEWVPMAGDHWLTLTDETEAVNYIKPGAVVFLATGRQSLPKFANLSHARLICRQIDPPDSEFPWPNGQYLIGRPPFSVADEESLFRQLDVDVLVVKNAGGASSRTKLDAARRLGISVLMIARPLPSGALSVQTLAEVEEWLDKWKS